MRYSRGFLLFAEKKAEEIGNDDIKEYLYYMVELKKASTFVFKIIIINALKFCYSEILKKVYL